MRSICKWLAIAVMIFVMVPSQSVWAKKYRIGYIQGGDYPTYAQLFQAVTKELQRIGWFDKIEFVIGYSAGWNREKCAKMAEKIAARDDLDMIWAFGTWAGQEIIKTSNHKTPIIVMSASNAVKSGIIPSVEDSGRDNLTTRIDPTKYERQIRLFYDLFRFKKLGFVYADTNSGRTYADLDMLKRVSKELGFELVGYSKVPENKKTAPPHILSGIKEIAPKIDAYYMTICIGFELDQVPDVMAVLNEHKIPTMSMYGADYVKAGALLTIADSRYAQRSRFTVAKIVKILEEGKSPRDFPIVFAPGPRLAINLAEAEIIGWDPPIDVLGSADHIFNEIKTPEQVIEERNADYGDLKGIWQYCEKQTEP